MMNTREHKKELRKKFKSIRLSLDSCEKEKFDSAIFNRFISLWAFRNCETIFIYVSTDIEVDTRAIIKYALSKGKRVAVPSCIDGTYEMDFYYINDFDKDLEKRSFGVLEPILSRCQKASPDKKSICVVPALAYDNEGYRLGYGKGYYDRFLEHFESEIIGLVYSSCIVEKLPHGKHDKNVNMIVCEKAIIPVLK